MATLLSACARTSPLLSTLPDDVFTCIVTPFLEVGDLARFVRACYPRAMTVSRWRNGKAEEEYGIGFKDDLRCEHLLLLRGRVFKLPELVDFMEDEKCIGRLFTEIRGGVRARDGGLRSPTFLSVHRLIGSHTLEEWNAIRADILRRDNAP